MEAWLFFFHATVLASVRLTLGFAMTPLFGAFGIPVMARLVLVFALAMVAVAGGTPSPPVLPDHTEWLALLGRECYVGLAMSAGVHAAFGALAVAGRLIDTQVGFSIGAIFDPASNAQSTVIGAGLSMLGVVLFFVADLHLLFFPALQASFLALPSWSMATLNGVEMVTMLGSKMFGLGLSMAAPVVVALLLADVMVAIVSRNMPQMNVLFISLPLKIVLGLMVMAGSIRVLGPVIQKGLLLPVHAVNAVGLR